MSDFLLGVILAGLSFWLGYVSANLIPAWLEARDL